MANENFYRTYILKCGKNGGHGFEIGNTGSSTENSLHISFSIEKADVESPNTAKVQIWNLSDENLKIMDGEDCIIELKAGYGSNMPLILVGDVTTVITTPDNADRMTEIEVMDGRVELRDTTVTISVNGSANCMDIYTQIAEGMGIPITFAGDLSFKSIPNGFSYVGKAKGALQKISKYCGHNWTIQNQVIQVTWPGRSVSEKGFLLNSETGLIGHPKRITIGAGSKDRESQTGWEIQYFLNGAIGVNDVVQIESPTANGYFRVQKVTFDGDNMEGDWMCTAQVLEIKAQPELDRKVSKQIS